MRGRSNGHTILELVVVVGIAIPIVALLLRGVASGVTWSLSTAEFARGVAAFSKTEALITAAVGALDHAPLSLPLRIHPVGRITFTDGAAHPAASGSYPPEPHSSPISSVEAAARSTLVLTDPSPGHPPIFCPRWGEPPEPTTKLFVGLTPEGACLYRGALHRRAGTPCFELTLTTVVSVTIPCAVPASALITTVIPIVREYTLYVDTSAQLRYLGHLGGAIIENQPLVRGVTRLTVTHGTALLGRISQFTAEITTSDGRTRAPSFTPRIIHSDFLNFLLGRDI